MKQSKNFLHHNYRIRKLTILVLNFEYGGYRNQTSRIFDLTSTDFIFENVSNDFLPW